MAQSRNWCFTLNNFTDEEEQECEEWVAESHATYLCVGKEVGESGTPHLQGYVQWTARRRLAFCKERFTRAHWEVSRAKDPAAAQTYCQKDGNYQEYGVMAQGGADNAGGARKRAYEAFKAGGAVAAEEAEPIVWAYQGHNLAKNIVRAPVPRPDIKCTWYHGKAGSGKSRAAWARFLEGPVEDRLPMAYAKTGDNRWWNGYRGEEYVIIDDLAKGAIHLALILTWCDRYPCRVETKGGMEPLYATDITITSNLAPDECFEKCTDEERAALFRRFEIIQK